ncbi:MAG: YfiM family protein, partial [Bacteroidia bacterium]|nr:YfiM family protein [Bacteroidia bacterium]
TAVEFLDGFSEEWGFSTGDIIANASGTGLLIGQEILWNEQRILLKYSFHTTDYAEKRPEILGDNILEQSLKDYNGQTYWLSANLWSFNKKSKIPKWLNMALGYGAEGMISGYEDVILNNTLIPGQERFRQFYVSLDVDLTKIKTRSKLLKTVFSAINFIKIPAPTFEINSKGKSKFHFLYF